MKNKLNKKISQKSIAPKMSRKEAMKKAGKYAAFTAATTVFLFSPKQAQAGSTPQNPGGGW